MKAILLHKDLNHFITSFAKKFVTTFNLMVKEEAEKSSQENKFMLYQIFPLWIFFDDGECTKIDFSKTEDFTLQGISFKGPNLYFDFKILFENEKNSLTKKMLFAKEIDEKDLKVYEEKIKGIFTELNFSSAENNFIFPKKINVFKSGQAQVTNGLYILYNEKWHKIKKDHI